MLVSLEVMELLGDEALLEVRDQFFFWFRVYLRRLDLSLNSSKVTGQYIAPVFRSTPTDLVSRLFLQQICTLRLQAHRCLTTTNQTLSLWFGSQDQPIMLKGTVFPQLDACRARNTHLSLAIFYKTLSQWVQGCFTKLSCGLTASKPKLKFIVKRP